MTLAKIDNSKFVGTVSPVAKPRFLVNHAIPSVYKVFLLFLYFRGVLFKNLNDATLSSLGNPPICKLRPP